MSFGIRSGRFGTKRGYKKAHLFQCISKKGFRVISPDNLAFSTSVTLTEFLATGRPSLEKGSSEFNSIVLRNGTWILGEIWGNGELSLRTRLVLFTRRGARVNRVPQLRNGENCAFREEGAGSGRREYAVARDSPGIGSFRVCDTVFPFTRFTLAPVIVDDATATLTD